MTSLVAAQSIASAVPRLAFGCERILPKAIFVDVAVAGGVK
jgi:hypothetical protein